MSRYEEYVGYYASDPFMTDITRTPMKVSILISESIVRCCSCKNMGDDERVFGDEWMPVKICNRMHDEQGECLIVQPDGFCAWGERKDEA